MPELELLKTYGPYAALAGLLIREVVRYFTNRTDKHDDLEAKILERAAIIIDARLAQVEDCEKRNADLTKRIITLEQEVDRLEREVRRLSNGQH